MTSKLDRETGKLQYPEALRDARCRDYLRPVRVVYTSGGELKPENADALLRADSHQVYVHFAPPMCRMKRGSAIVLDFGIELNGGIRITTGYNNHVPSPVRIRFGESVSEAMHTPDNDHAMHNTVVDLPSMGTVEIGNTGFRFVRIEVMDNAPEAVDIQAVMAVAIYRDLPYVGSFQCSDERLNRIWQVGAYTVHLNMQDYIYDGIKRDRLVWMGDLHPEIKVICNVFDDVDAVQSSLDFLRDRTALPNFMNGMSPYSLWWIISQHDWYLARGNFSYLQEQREYLLELLHLFAGHVSEDGAEHLEVGRFLDWPSNDNPAAIHAGLQGLMAWAFQAGENLCSYLGAEAAAKECAACRNKLLRHSPDGGMSKQANAFKVIAGIDDAKEVNARVLAVDPFHGVSTFMGYYILRARAEAGDVDGALDVVRKYWGGMLDFGATTFWEDFDLRWTENAGRIDELPVAGKKDLHADFGNYCYKGLRHSLCHGWAGGPTAWLSEYVLGVKPVEPGYKTVSVKPELGDLDWAEGQVPTPYGTIRVRAEKAADGSVTVSIEAPEGVTILR